jgi:hypothetical protein
VCGCIEPKEKDPLLYNRTYVDRLKRWREDKSKDTLFGPSVIDVDGARDLLYKSGGARGLGGSGLAVVSTSWEPRRRPMCKA